MNKINLAGVVVLYKPSSEVYDNIISYSHRLDKLYIVDNTPQYISNIALSIKSCLSDAFLITSGENIGIAKALNIALEHARSDGFEWLMTMDQDTSFDSENLDIFLTCFKELATSKSIIYAPLHNPKYLSDSSQRCLTEEVEFVMTSANIVHVNTALEIGGFDENLFIDDVDHEFCFRAQSKDYSITQFSHCYVRHQLGESVNDGKNIYKLYPPERLYFMIRNFLYLKKKYGALHEDFFKKRVKYFVRFFSQQLRFSSCRYRMIRMLIKGVIDYFLKHYGKGSIDV